MKISELIAKLEEIKSKEGDLPAYIYHSDFYYEYEVEIKEGGIKASEENYSYSLEGNEMEKFPKRVILNPY